MHTLADLTKRYGLSDRSLRRRLTALRPEIDPYIHRGPRNAIILTDNGLVIMDRLIDLERSAGLGLTSAAAQVKVDILTAVSEATTIAEERPNSAEVATADLKDELIVELRARIEEQADRITSLERQLEERGREIERLHDLLNRILPGVAEAEGVTKTELKPKKARKRRLRGPPKPWQ